MRFDEHFLRGVLPEGAVVQATFPKDINVSVDTRTLQKGDIFVALSGAVYDGHDFIQEALKKGAAGLVIAESKKDLLPSLSTKVKNKLLIVVKDPLRALVSMATAWREQFAYPIVAITGSVGKTSVKELLATMLYHNGTSFIASSGNQNTNIGISLNILRMRPTHEVAIFEAGISRRGEMAELVKILKPTTAIITNVGHAHMEGLGSLADIALEKRDVFKQFSHESIGIINGDQPILSNVGYAHPVIKFGTKTTNQIQARKIHVSAHGISFILKLYKDKYPIMLNTTHEGAVFNALAAASAAHFLNVPREMIVRGIQEQQVVGGRFEQRKLKNDKGILIHDCYNANPESMKGALLAFEKIKTNAPKIAVLGDMLELGVNSSFWHRQVGRFLRKVPTVRQVILVGNMVEWTKKTLPVGVHVEVVPTWREAVPILQESIGDESCVLVKGSLGMGLGNLVKEVSDS